MHSLSLLTDLYQLTMAAGYFKSGMSERRSAFQLFFRKLPFKGGYAIAAGLADALKWLEGLRFDASDIAYLGTLTGADNKPLFDQAFLDYLAQLTFTCDVFAIPEGTTVFEHEPLMRIEGPLLQAQLVETALLNIINFQTLIATKAARVCEAAKGEPVLEFGLRRAQGIDGSLSASRAAYIGGVSATSNVLAGKLYGIPVKGTHAHSWVMAFPDEKQAFATYAKALPNNCVFLVDTYDTLEGVRHAIEVGRELKANGYKLNGVRLDSGDLAYLSIEARKLLDEAGFHDTTIVASNDLDESLIENLKQQGARINVWGVGTKLVTAYDQPALGGVYKLAAIQDEKGVWHHKVKVSEQAVKTSNPGLLQVRRYRNKERFVADAIFDSEHAPKAGTTIVDARDSMRRTALSDELAFEDLLTPVMKQGARVAADPKLIDIQARAKAQLAMLHPTIRRLLNPHEYPAGLDERLHEEKARLVAEHRAKSPRFRTEGA
jgi:nicotinate phosphoribosyltransferase